MTPVHIKAYSRPVQSAKPLPPPAKSTPVPTPVAKTSVLSKSTAIVRGDFGIAGDMAPLDSAQLNTTLDGIKALGVGWVRYDIDWNNIEQAQGQYDWTDYDREVQAVAAHGLKSLLIIDYTPPWARRSDCSDSMFCAPANASDYGNFAAAVAARYSPYGIHWYKIWNEPNNTAFFLPAANAAEYTGLLQAAYTSIKQVDPHSLVITGGTSPADSSGGDLSPVDFISGIYAAGAKGYFDAIAAHPYTWPYSPAWYNPDGAWGQMTTMHNIMAANGDGWKKIWITEFGAPTGGPGTVASNGFDTSEGGADHVTEALQARIVSDSITLESSVSWIGPYFWYSYQDSGYTSDTVENFFGLLRYDGSFKPAYYTFKQMVAIH